MTTVTDLKQQQKSLWGGSATDWETWDDWFEDQSKNLTEWICAKSGISAGMHVLDLACGAGQPGFTAAKLVGPGGRIVSSDLAPEMVAVAQRLGAARGLTNLEHREVDIEDIPFADQTFDAVTCRLGLMFCPEPARGAAEIRRVLKPGGRFALTVWDIPARNEQFTSFLGPLGEVVTPAAPNPKAPGLFRLAAPGELEAVLHEGGFEDIEIEPVVAQWEFSSAENYWDVMTVLAAPLKAAVATFPADNLQRLKGLVIDGLRASHGEGPVKLTATALGATGRK